MTSKALIIPAAGAGRRMQQDQPKPFLDLDGATILGRTINCFLPVPGLQKIVVATAESYLAKTETILQQHVGDACAWQCVVGGAERQDSIRNALAAISGVDLVLVHDAVRPFVRLQDIVYCCDEAEQTGAAIMAIPSRNTIKKVDANHMVEHTPDRKFMWQVQTPQVFKTALLKRAYARAAENNYLGTDDASLVEWLDEPVKVVPGSAKNIKITYPQDLKLARILLKEKRE